MHPAHLLRTAAQRLDPVAAWLRALSRSEAWRRAPGCGSVARVQEGRRAYAHEAVVALADGGDERAPGGAVTVALCGSWSHDPPCPLAPHHTAAVCADEGLRLRVLFAADPADEARVRELVEVALARGRVAGPDGVRTSWRLVSAGPSDVRPEERDHARRLAAG